MSKLEITFPARMLHVFRAVNTLAVKYDMSNVFVEASADTTTVGATDGRRLVLAERKQENKQAGTLYIPSKIAGLALQNAKKPKDADANIDTVPMATVASGKSNSIEVYSDIGPLSFSWQSNEVRYPPYRSVIPDASEKGTHRIGLSNQLLADTLKIMSAISGDDAVRFLVPPTEGKPIVLRSSGLFDVMAVVMPLKISRW